MLAVVPIDYTTASILRFLPHPIPISLQAHRDSPGDKRAWWHG